MAGEPATVTRVYDSLPNWMSSTRHWEAAETTRLNSSHWTYADMDESVNAWLLEHLATLRSRAIYESRQNGVLLGMIGTHADDIVGQDGPTLQVQSDDEQYNDTLESVWQEWFAAPTQRQNVSGAALLKVWIRNLWRCGEFLARIATVDDSDGPIKMRLLPTHPRRLATPAGLASDANVVMGIRFDRLDRPATYYIQDQPAMGTGATGYQATPYPADLIVHEFLVDEEDQARGIPLATTALPVAADLRDYDDQVQDAARLMADQATLLYTDAEDAPVWTAPESAEIERRTIKMAPPRWKPVNLPAAQPPVQYPDYRAERQIEMGRPAGMPRMLVRLDASKHSWASARLDMTTYRRACGCLQAWLSGSAKSAGTLNRLVDEVEREARFYFSELRRRPRVVEYQWTWPQLDDVEPVKTQQANQIGLQSQTLTLTDILTNRKKTLRAHIEEMRREREAFEAAGLPLPAWMSGVEAAAVTQYETIDSGDED